MEAEAAVDVEVVAEAAVEAAHPAEDEGAAAVVSAIAMNRASSQP
jgi:hypothetical protein